MTREELDFIGSMNMCDEISNEAYKKIVCHCREQEPCKDAISRKAVINQLFYSTDNNGDVVLGSALRERIASLPSVILQEPKTGHWIEVDANMYACSNCSHCFSIVPEDNSIKQYKYCPNCKCRMVEPRESEE